MELGAGPQATPQELGSEKSQKKAGWTQADANPLGPASPWLQINLWAVQVNLDERGTEARNCEAAPQMDWAEDLIGTRPE